MTFWQITFSFGAVLQLLILVAMTTRMWVRSYFVLFLYSLLNFSSTVVETFARFGKLESGVIRDIYWFDEAVLQLCVFAVVISLIRHAVGPGPARRRIGAVLIALTLLIAAVSYWFYQGDSLSRYMTHVSRNLSFTSAILNLILWTTLARSPEADRQLLMVSGGLGIQTTGEAIGHSLRVIAKALTGFGNLVIVLSYLMCLFVWWRAFSQGPAAAPRGAAPR